MFRTRLATWWRTAATHVRHVYEEYDKYEQYNPLPHLLLTQNAIRTLCTRKAIDVCICEVGVAAIVGSAVNTAFGGCRGCFTNKFPIAFDAAKEDRAYANNGTLDARTCANNTDELVRVRVHVRFCSQPIRFGNRAGEVCACGRGSPVAFRAERGRASPAHRKPVVGVGRHGVICTRRTGRHFHCLTVFNPFK